MDKVEIKQIVTEYKIHKFYCDDCGKFLLESKESYDDYYQQPKKYYIQHVKLIGNYCEECGSKRARAVIDFAKKMGFDIDYDKEYRRI